MAKRKKHRGEVPLHDRYGFEVRYAVEAEALLPTTKHEEEMGAVWFSFDVDCLDAAFVQGTGWPRPGGFMPHEELKFLQIIADTKPLAGMEIVECSTLSNAAEITSLMATRVICDVLACQVRSGHLGGDEKSVNSEVEQSLPLWAQR